MRNRRQHNRERRASGQALVPVLFVVVILTALAVTLSSSARRDVRAAANFVQNEQVARIARGAILYAAYELQTATNNGAQPPQLSPPPDTDSNGWTQLGDGWYKVEIIDTASRLNINTATGAQIAALPGIADDASIAAAIVDWRDADDTVGTLAVSSGSFTGAESDYYPTLDPPYNAKNAPFDTVDELLLVRGVTPTLLYGQAGVANAPGAASGEVADDELDFRSRAASRQSATSATLPTDTSTTSSTPLCEMVTTYSKELNVAADGTQRLNMKTATAEQMVSQLGLDATLAQRLVQWRQQSGNTLNSISDLLNVSGFTRTVMQQIGDKIKMSDSQTRDGVININTAPAEVLATIPKVDSTIYNAIIQARESGTVFTGMNDLFALTSLSRTQLQTLVDSVCTKSSVYLVRVKVRLKGSPRIYAAQALVEIAPDTSQSTTSTTSGSTTGATSATSETTTPTPIIMQWREVARRPGWSSWVAPPNYSTSGGTVANP